MSLFLRLSRLPPTLGTPQTLRLPKIPSSPFLQCRSYRYLIPKKSTSQSVPTPRTAPQPAPRLASKLNLPFGLKTDQAELNSYIVWYLIGLNSAFYLMYSYLQTETSQGHHKRMNRFIRLMTMSWQEVVDQGRVYQMLTSTIAHLSFNHLLGNMLGLYFLGGFLARQAIITPLHFATITIGSGLAGSAGWVAQKCIAAQAAREAGQPVQGGRAVGFSGSLMGISTVAAFLSPTTRFYIWGVVPMPLWLIVTGYAAYDGYYLNNSKSNVAHAGHLGGLAFGAAYYLLRLRGLKV